MPIFFLVNRYFAALRPLQLHEENTVEFEYGYLVGAAALTAIRDSARTAARFENALLEVFLDGAFLGITVCQSAAPPSRPL